jgi:hypothetical protein
MQAEYSVEAWLVGHARTFKEDQYPHFSLGAWGSKVKAYHVTAPKMAFPGWQQIYRNGVEYYAMVHSRASATPALPDGVDENDPRAAYDTESESEGQLLPTQGGCTADVCTD